MSICGVLGSGASLLCVHKHRDECIDWKLLMSEIQFEMVKANLKMWSLFLEFVMELNAELWVQQGKDDFFIILGQFHDMELEFANAPCLQSLSSTCLKNFLKKYCINTLDLLCALRTVVTWESIFFFLRGENQQLFCLRWYLVWQALEIKLSALKRTLISLIKEWQNNSNCTIRKKEEKIWWFCVLTSLQRVFVQEEGITWAPGEGLLWSGVLVPALARNFPQGGWKRFKKKIPKPLKMGLYVSFLCLYAGGIGFHLKLIWLVILPVGGLVGSDHVEKNAGLLGAFLYTTQTLSSQGEILKHLLRRRGAFLLTSLIKIIF